MILDDHDLISNDLNEYRYHATKDKTHTNVSATCLPDLRSADVGPPVWVEWGQRWTIATMS